MKKIFITLLISLSIISCKKEITPGNYKAGTQDKDTIDNSWVNNYQNGGTVPVWNSNQNNELFGTTWVLIKVVSAFATSYPNDTIKFVNNTNYTLNNGAVRPYQLSSSAGSTNKTLALYYFAPFGGSHYSAQVGFYFVSDGFIDNAEFTNIQNTTATTRAWFVKL